MEWINVKDKLPEHKNIVLVCAKTNKDHPFFSKMEKSCAVVLYLDRIKLKEEIGAAMPDDFLDDSIWASLEIQGMSLNNVTHWRYLPKLPEDE